MHNAILGGGFWYPPYTISSRKIYRHESGYGSVLQYVDNDGTSKRVLVLDACYRTISRFGQGNKNAANLPDYDHVNSKDNNWISGTSNKSFIKQLTDKKLNTLYSANNYDRNTSRHNCDIWMTYKGINDGYNTSGGITAMTGVPAVEYCRSIVVPSIGIPCDLPNINILWRLYIERHYIDRLDLTANDARYSQYALGYKNPVGDFCFAGSKNVTTDKTAFCVWSSTESVPVAGIDYNLCICSLGQSTYANRNVFSLGVTPIVELD